MSAGGFDQHQLADRDPDSSTANVHDIGLLARSHQDITILFMDIVGELRGHAKCKMFYKQLSKVVPQSNVPTIAVRCWPGFTSMSKGAAGCCHEFPQLVRARSKADADHLLLVPCMHTFPWLMFQPLFLPTASSPGLMSWPGSTRCRRWRLPATATSWLTGSSALMTKALLRYTAVAMSMLYVVSRPKLPYWFRWLSGSTCSVLFCTQAHPIQPIEGSVFAASPLAGPAPT